LDILRKNLNNITVVSPMVLLIRDQLENGWITMDANQKDLLDSVLDRLSNPDTIVSVWVNEYEKNKQEILAMLPTSLKSEIAWLFDDFEEGSYDLEWRANVLQDIWDKIEKEWKKNWWIDDEDIANVIHPAFCNIFEYYDISRFSNKCSSDAITQTWAKSVDESWLSSNSSKSGWLPWRLKVILIVLVWWLLVMWWVIVFFSVKARLNSWGDDEDEW
jgi:hypothetical protein